MHAYFWSFFCQAQPQPQFNWADVALVLIFPAASLSGQIVKKLEISTTDNYLSEIFNMMEDNLIYFFKWKTTSIF
jgi:hypothetical protein